MPWWPWEDGMPSYGLYHELLCPPEVAVGQSPMAVAGLNLVGQGNVTGRLEYSKQVQCRSLSSIHILYNQETQLKLSTHFLANRSDCSTEFN